MVESTSALPSHVPPNLVHDVDPYQLEGGSEDAHLAWKRVQQGLPDIYFTPRHGGYWVLNRAELLKTVWPDHERFASSGAIAVPPLPPGMPEQPPIQSDPPLHRHFRQPIVMAVSPRQIQGLSVAARELTIELIDGLLPKGECEFIQEFAMQLPMTIFLRLVNLPQEDRAWLIGRAEKMTRGSASQRGEAFQELMGYLDKWVRERRANPGSDLISEIANVQLDGRPISHEEAVAECALTLFGGLDTVASTMAFFARFLAENPAHRQQLVDSPSLIPAAVEELMRRFSIPLVSRRVTQDLELGGVQMKAGDLVILETCLHGLDERAWPDPLRVDFSRRTNDLMAFGAGVHKCPGANLARAELRIFLEEWLKRIPNFSIKPGTKPVTATGAVIGMLSLSLTWPIN